MRRLLIGVALMLASAAPAASHNAFSPIAEVPDHVVTMVKPAISGQEDSRVVQRHGPWIRIDTLKNGRARTTHFKSDNTLTVRIYPGGGDESRAIEIVRETFSGVDHSPVATGERRTHLGESCAVWKIFHPASSRRGRFTRTSCVTDDGIELWFVITNDYGISTAAEATRIERRSVARSEAEPPANMLSLDSWLAPVSGAASGPDYATVMVRGGRPDVIRTLRQHAGWTYDEIAVNGVRHSLSVRSASRSLMINFYNLNTSVALLSISQRQEAVQEPPVVMRPKMLERRESLLGETCNYFNMAPNMDDASHLACKTNDGVTLIDERHGRSTRQIDRAVSVRRGPLSLRDVMPPADLLSAKTWGLPE